MSTEPVSPERPEMPKVPDALPVLPLRDSVVLPLAAAPLAVGKPSSVQLVDDVRAAQVPATLRVEGTGGHVPAGLELSAYRIVQEALTNVLKHAGPTTHVDVTVRHLPGSLALEVRDDGRGLVASSGDEGSTDGSGHGHVGMRERVELWGGELSLGAAPGGGYRVKALLPYGDDG